MQHDHTYRLTTDRDRHLLVVCRCGKIQKFDGHKYFRK